MKKLYAIVLLFSTLIFEFVSCAEDEDVKPALQETNFENYYAVGKEVTIDDEQYLIIKNDFDMKSSTGRAVFKSDSGEYYQNEKAQTLRRKKIEQDFGITSYVEAFKITTRSTKSIKGISNFADIYLVLNADKTPLYKINQTWQSTAMFEGTTAEKAEAFNKLTENEVREYDPDYFTFESLKGIYGTDLSKKIKMQFVYKHSEEDLKVVDYDDLRKIQDYKDFFSIDKKERSIWRTHTTYMNNEVDVPTYMIQDPISGSNFCNFVINKNNYKLQAEGDGAINGSTSTSVWRGEIKVSSVTSEKAVFTVTKTDTDVSDGGTTYNTIYSELSSASQESKYISVSENVTINNMEVPSKITFTAPFKKSTVPLQKYTAVSWYPEYDESTMSIKYKPDYEEWINNYKKDFEQLYYKSLDVFINLTADNELDKKNPIFKFTGNSIKIELEDMYTNFEIVEDSDASNGKAGKLENNQSYAMCYITFPAGEYSGVLSEKAPDANSDALYFLFGEDENDSTKYVRVYPNKYNEYEETDRTPFQVKTSEEITVRVKILKDSPAKSGESGMFIDYLKFTKI